ncbi:MAG: COG4315 family predicted lipoprotein [Nitrospirota bacterium]
MNSRQIRGMIAAAVIMLLAVGTVALAAGAVQVKTKDGVGSYLADGKGMTLYYFMKDKGATGGACAGPCLENWPVFHAEAIGAVAGVDAKDFGVITRADGKKQTTYRGWPLYYFVNDKAAGDTKGQGIKDIWYVVDPAKIQANQ